MHICRRMLRIIMSGINRVHRQTDIPLTLLQVREGKSQHQTSQVMLSQTIKSSPQLQCCFLCHSQQLCIHMCHVRMERTEVVCKPYYTTTETQLKILYSVLTKPTTRSIIVLIFSLEEAWCSIALQSPFTLATFPSLHSPWMTYWF